MAFRTIEVELRANVAGYAAQMGAAARTTKDFARETAGLAASKNEAVQMMGKAALVAGGAVVAGFGLAIREASQFETRMRNVNSIMKQSESEFRNTSEAVLDISRRVPQAATTLADGLYDIASSGFQGSEGLQVLEASAIAATAGMSDTATAAKSITGILNAYGMEASEAGDISDILFQTVNVGVITFEELAASVGDWVGTAAALKVPVDEASAALAAMTLSGIGAAEASTALNRVMQSFIKPSEDMTAQIQDLGYESGVAMVEALGLRGAVMAIEEATGGSVEETANLYREVRAIKGVLALTAADGANYASTFGAITDETARADAAQQAYEEQSKAFSVQLDLAKSSVSAVAIEIGTFFLPAMTTAAEVVAGLADGFSVLPGPLQTIVIAFAGVSGAVALVGGAAIVAAPKVMAFKTSLDAMAVSAPRAAAGVNLVTSAAGKLAKGGLFVAVVAGGAIAVDSLAKSLYNIGRDGPPAVDDLVESLGHLGKVGGSIGAPDGQSWEEYLDGFAASAGRVRDSMNRWSFTNIGFTPPKLDAAKDDVEAMDEALTGLLEQDYQAGLDAWDALKREWEATGRPLSDLEKVLPGVQDALDGAEAAAEAGRLEFERMKDEAAALGYNLDDSSELIGMTTEEIDELAAAVDPAILAMVQIGDVTIEQAKEMQSALQSYVDSVASAFASITSPLAIHSQLLADQEAAHQKWAESQAAATDDAEDTWEDFASHQAVSLDDFVEGLNATVWKTAAFAAGIQDAIAMGYDPQIIADLLAAGPETAGPMLETLLSDHSGRMVEMVNEGAEALRELNLQAAEMARITHLATTATTDEMNRDLATAMEISQRNMAEGGKKSAEALSKELGIGVEDVRRIAANFGITLAEGLNPVLAGVGANQIRFQFIPGQQATPIGYAAGGTVLGVGDTDVVPAVLTPGEYVMSKPAVRAIGVDTLDRLNRRRYQTGGFVTPGDVPRPPDVSGYGDKVGYTGDAAMLHAHEAARDWVERNAMVATGSSTGLDPAFLRMFNLYNAALGGILRIISGFRSSAQQASLYARYLAGTGNLAAPPGRSRHERGLAIDHAPNSTASMRRTASGFGLHYPVRREPWHVEPIHIRDHGGPLMPGLTWNGTGRPEVVVGMESGGLVTALPDRSRLAGGARTGALPPIMLRLEVNAPVYLDGEKIGSSRSVIEGMQSVEAATARNHGNL